MIFEDGGRLDLVSGGLLVVLPPPRSQASLCGIRDGQSAIGTNYFRVVPLSLLSIIPPLLLIHSSITDAM
jgi:hypothetical protein